MIPTFPRAMLALALSLLASQSPAQGMSDTDRQALRAEIRAYLLENPEVLMEAIGVLEERQQSEAAAADREMLSLMAPRLFDDPASWAGGNLQGDVTLVEFIDYRCGYCRRAWAETEELVASDGNIRRVIKEFPILGEQSALSSRFAIATLQVAGADAYKAVHDALLAMRSDAVPEALERLATEQGLDAAAIMARMDAPEVTAVIEANYALAQALQLNGTPSYVVDGTMVRGYVPLAGMRDIVAQQRAAN